LEKEERLPKKLFFEGNPMLEKLAKFKPAQIELLINTRKSDLKTLLKLTFFDLLFKQVLIVKKKYLQSRPSAPVREVLIVETGDRFSEYKNRNDFESYFLNRIDEETYHYLIPYLRGIYKVIPSENHFKRHILDDDLTSYIKNDFFLKLFGSIRLNHIGKDLSINFKNCLKEVDANILDLIGNHPKKAITVINKLKGNIFLLENLNFELFETLKITFPKQENNDLDHIDY